MDKNRNIVRINQGFGIGWQVKVHRRGQRHQPFFGDSRYGGYRKALAAARAARDELELRYPPYSRREIAQLVTRRNRSGVRGLRIRTNTRIVGRKKRVYRFVEASWCPVPGVVTKKSFSIARHGKEQAWQLALKASEKGVRTMFAP